MPDTIEEIHLGQNFNLELDNLPSTIKKIKFDIYSGYDKKLNCLPNGLSILELPIYYKQQICIIPRTLTKLICSRNYPYLKGFSNIHVETHWKKIIFE